MKIRRRIAKTTLIAGLLLFVFSVLLLPKIVVFVAWSPGVTGNDIRMFYGFVPDLIVVWTARHALSAGYGSRVQIHILDAMENQEGCTVQRLDDLLVEKLNSSDLFVRIAVMRLM